MTESWGLWRKHACENPSPPPPPPSPADQVTEEKPNLEGYKKELESRGAMCRVYRYRDMVNRYGPGPRLPDRTTTGPVCAVRRGRRTDTQKGYPDLLYAPRHWPRASFT